MKHINGSQNHYAESKKLDTEGYMVISFHSHEMFKQENSPMETKSRSVLPEVGDGKTDFKGAQGGFGG